jgi:hypothetical protein
MEPMSNTRCNAPADFVLQPIRHRLAQHDVAGPVCAWRLRGGKGNAGSAQDKSNQQSAKLYLHSTAHSTAQLTAKHEARRTVRVRLCVRVCPRTVVQCKLSGVSTVHHAQACVLRQRARRTRTISPAQPGALTAGAAGAAHHLPRPCGVGNQDKLAQQLGVRESCDSDLQRSRSL